MKTIAKIFSAIGLTLTLLPSILFFNHKIEWDMLANLMLAGTIIWFLSAPFWMKKDKA